MRQIKKSPKGKKTVTLVGVQIDNDLLPYLKAQPNKSRFVNDAIRFSLSKNLVESK